MLFNDEKVVGKLLVMEEQLSFSSGEGCLKVGGPCRTTLVFNGEKLVRKLLVVAELLSFSW